MQQMDNINGEEEEKEFGRLFIGMNFFLHGNFLPYFIKSKNGHERSSQ